MNVSEILVTLVLAGAACLALVRYLRRWQRPWREVVVWPGDPLHDGEGITLVFRNDVRLPLAKRSDGGFRGYLHNVLLEQPFIVCRTPDDVRETGFHGQDVPPRSAAAIDEPLWVFPAAWRDRPPHDARLTRVGSHEDFPIGPSKRVEKTRMIRVHLPAAYAERPDAHFPVVYLLDGQNVFDASTAFGGVEWCIDEIAHRPETEGELAPILVGIDNGGMRREGEYTFCPIDGTPPAPAASTPATARAHPSRGGGAEEHLAFILEEVDPCIRRRYRVTPGPGCLVGSSLGGLFALWAAIAHPTAFHAVAAVSPSIWWGRGAILTLPLADGTPRARVWLCMGSNEGQGAEKAFELAIARLHALGWREGDDLMGLLVKGGHHHESAWADRSPTILRFLCAKAC